jgi:hypothetical protein
MREIDYYIKLLRDYGFNDIEILDFLSIVYNCMQSSKDVESQISYGSNNKYKDVYYQYSDELDNLIVNNSVQNMGIDPITKNIVIN